MAQITFITGGQRSGKSSYAQTLASGISDSPVYLATARRWDEDFERRILRHQADRGSNWTTIEEEKYIAGLDLTGKTVVLDCITLWLNNFFFDANFDMDAALREAKNEWNKFIEQDFTLFAVSNELGMGLHADNEKARQFADMQGWINQHIAASAQKVVLMISGIPLVVK